MITPTHTVQTLKNMSQRVHNQCSSASWFYPHPHKLYKTCLQWTEIPLEESKHLHFNFHLTHISSYNWVKAKNRPGWFLITFIIQYLIGSYCYYDIIHRGMKFNNFLSKRDVFSNMMKLTRMTIILCNLHHCCCHYLIKKLHSEALLTFKPQQITKYLLSERTLEIGVVKIRRKLKNNKQ